MSHIRIIAAAAVAAVGLAGTADAAVVSKQKVRSGHTAPITIAGTGVKQGDRLPSGARLVYRDVTLKAGEKVRLSINAPSGKRLLGLMPGSSGGRKVDFTVVSPFHYPGKKRVVVRASHAPKATGTIHGRIYALVR